MASIQYGLPCTSRWSLLGVPYACPPHLPHRMVTGGPLSWRWFPWHVGFEVLHRLLLLAGAATAVSGFGVFIIGLGRNRAGRAIGGLALLLLGIALFLVGYVLMWNASARAAAALARGKVIQAVAMWAVCTEPWVAKDPFHEEKVGLGVSLMVLRDGSTEVRAAGPTGEYLASAALFLDGGALDGGALGVDAGKAVTAGTAISGLEDVAWGEQEEAPPPTVDALDRV